MRLKLFPPASLAVFLVLSALPGHAQVAAAGEGRTIPFNVGAGFSNYDTDIGSYQKADVGSDRLSGGTVWMDYDPTFLPGRLYGLGIEAQGRDLDLNHTTDQPYLREDVASGGAIYRWNRIFAVRPYGEFLMGFGNADYETTSGLHYHQTRTVTTAGGGAEFDAFHRLWVRADYEYEWWPDFFINGKPNVAAPRLQPQGITLGFTYHFAQGFSR
jgi:opacity protein-like surface antigen